MQTKKIAEMDWPDVIQSPVLLLLLFRGCCPLFPISQYNPSHEWVQLIVVSKRMCWCVWCFVCFGATAQGFTRPQVDDLQTAGNWWKKCVDWGWRKRERDWNWENGLLCERVNVGYITSVTVLLRSFRSHTHTHKKEAQMIIWVKVYVLAVCMFVTHIQQEQRRRRLLANSSKEQKKKEKRKK